MTEIPDFADALRQMAANADRLAERVDLREVAGLRRQVEEQASKAERDADLIAELRRQVEAMGRSLDAIGRMRKRMQMGDAADGVQILVDALQLAARDGCENFADGWSCSGAGRTRGAMYAAKAWCLPCVARDGLERAGALEPVTEGRSS
jgi:hypothetical protein